MSSLVVLPPTDFAVFERRFLLEYYTQRANFTYKVSLALRLPGVNSYLVTCFLLYAKPSANAKMLTVTSA